MTLADAVKLAVTARDARRCGQIAMQLRARGANYADVLAFAVKHTGIDPADWESLMYECDEGEEE